MHIIRTQLITNITHKHINASNSHKILDSGNNLLDIWTAGMYLNSVHIQRTKQETVQKNKILQASETAHPRN